MKRVWGGLNRALLRSGGLESAKIFRAVSAADDSTPSQLDGCFETFCASGSGNYIACRSLLHNVAYLLDVLGGPSPPSPDSLDNYLILKAYERWGEDVAGHLEGEFSFAVWDAACRKLFCCRDHLGASSLYYWFDQDRFVFAETPLDLIENGPVTRKLNRHKLAATAIFAGHLYFDEETFFEGVMSLPPGTTLVVDHGGIRKRTYWHPEVKPELIPAGDDEAFHLLRMLTVQAVENRMRGGRSIATFLSGGLDSSAIASIASRALARDNRELMAFSAVVPDERRASFPDERPYIEEFSGFPNVRIHYVDAAERGPFDLIHEPAMFQDSFLRGPAAYLADALEDAACEYGADRGLVGNGGEFGVTWRGDGYVLELLSRFSLGKLWKQLREMRSTMGISPVRVLARELLNALVPLRGKRPSICLTASFKSSCEARKTVTRSNPFDQRSTHVNALRWLLRTHARTGFFRNGGKIPFLWPLLDRKLIEFCIAAPGHMKIRDGYPRYLVRKALDGLLPKKIQWRKDKLVASVDYRPRYTAQLGIARNFVAVIGRNDPVRSIVDVKRLDSMLARPDYKESGQVLVNIYLICFLRQFADFRL